MLTDDRLYHLSAERLQQFYGAIPEVQTILQTAAQWHTITELLSAKGWLNVTPALIAALLPDLPPRHTPPSTSWITEYCEARP